MRQSFTISHVSRRRFMRQLSAVTAGTSGINVLGFPGSSLFISSTRAARTADSLKLNQRANQAYQIRHKAALEQMNLLITPNENNGDEELYGIPIGSYSKAMPHNPLGEVDVNAFNSLVHAVTTTESIAFNAIPKGGTIKQTNPQSALAFELAGADSHHLSIPAPPPFASEDEAAEMCEVYWQAVTRDIPYSQYGLEPLTTAAIKDLSRFAKFQGIHAGNLFRGETTSDLIGPYISQYLWKPFPFGALPPIQQRYRTGIPGDDHLTNYGVWQQIQNGVAPSSQNVFQATPRFIADGRDLAEWDHRDFTYQGFLVAALILLSFGPAAIDDSNPYKTSANQTGFATFGAPHILDLVARVAGLALKAAWHQKWNIHRRLRPEEFGGRVHNHMTGAASYPIHSKLLDSHVLQEIFNQHGAYLLPMAYPEGAPTHPSYPAGHAVIAGAGVTVLKAFFNESFAIPNPVIVSSDGVSLEPYDGTLFVGDELNKLAANIAIGRDAAGVHWRSDGIEGIKLGEEVAISVLRDYKRTFNENFAGFSFSKFDGSTVLIR